MRRHRKTSEAETADLCATDSEVVQKARQGDDAAWHELVDRHAGALFRLAVSLVGNAADAEDVVQETFIGALRGLKAFEERSSLKTWLTRILVKQAARCHRSRARRKTVSIRDLAEASRPVDAREEIDTRLDVLGVLEALPAEHRQVIVLREFEGYSYREMAQMLDIPRGTVESRLFRARQALRERLSGYLP